MAIQNKQIIREQGWDDNGENADSLTHPNQLLLKPSKMDNQPTH